MAKRVAVIGAGPTGLMALKNLREDGFNVTGFESRPYVGGLWKHSTDESISAAANTVFNSSIYRSAASDFPFPEDADDFPTSKQMYNYLESYCDHFGLRKNIKLSTRVVGIQRDEKEWVIDVETASESGSTTRSERFDKVVVATGSFTKPKYPKIEGLGLLEGPKIHSINFHDATQFQGKNVLLVGLHATAQDVTAALHERASKVYISHRTGLVMLPRYEPDGATFDQAQTLNLTFAIVFMSTWVPTLMNMMFDIILRSMSAKAYPNIPASWGFSPAPSTLVTNPLIADVIYPFLESGFAEPVPQICKIVGPKAVELSNGRVLEDVDAIIYCTGYDFAVPMLSKEFDPYPIVGDVPNLYRGMIPLHPDPSVRDSLAFLGHAAIPFPGLLQFELQGMAVSQLWQGLSKIPPLDEMKRWHEGWIKWRSDIMAKQRMKSTFYTAMVPFGDHLSWLDKIAGTGIFDNFGWFKIRAWAFWWNDRELYRLCKSGLFTPVIWRLFDLGKRKPLEWSKARAMVFSENERARKQVQTRLAATKKNV
ncbi:hypothetical protein FKW77_005654 [Venturia effusa]|uniref:FAD/NAD(P)-binding domain-containing protein n=1 Tax=Venturia effusa TaxID=50376 RepID=A0A517KZH1_9PEZI|nr:hypothetical protein FKW77_005654 [Venturia effusa]